MFNLDCTLNNTDFWGGDIELRYATNHQECGIKCNQNGLCKKWTFLPHNNIGQCYLKGNKSYHLKHCRHCISGFGTIRDIQCRLDGKLRQTKFIKIFKIYILVIFY